MQEIEQDKHYVERFQLIPVDEQTYTYEQHTNHSAGGSNQVQSNGAQIDASALVKRDSSSTDREISMAEQQNVPTTVYVSQSNDEDVLRYPPNTQVRYEEEAYHHRYEYQAHPGHGNPEDIKVELVRAQQHHHQQQTQSHAGKVQIYEQHDGGPRGEVISRPLNS